MPSRGRVKPTWFPACLGRLSGTEPLSKIAKCAGKVLGFSLLFQAVRAWISSTSSNRARSGEGDLLSFIKQFPLFSPSESRRSHADPTHSSPSAGTKSFDFCPDFSGDPDELPTSPCSLTVGATGAWPPCCRLAKHWPLFLSSTTQHEPRHGNWTSTLGNCFRSNKEMEIGNHSPNQDSVG